MKGLPPYERSSSGSTLRELTWSLRSEKKQLVTPCVLENRSCLHSPKSTVGFAHERWFEDNLTFPNYGGKRIRTAPCPAKFIFF
uniref:Uncharacterized protein n=1 Tax=Anguilla anguilla TaxID=7936 RepID=A0A0E9S6Y8_ANGAN